MDDLCIQLEPSPGRRCPISIGAGRRSVLATTVDLASASQVVLLTDENVARHWLEPFLQELPGHTVSITIPAGESHKNLATLEQVWTDTGPDHD